MKMRHIKFIGAPKLITSAIIAVVLASGGFYFLRSNSPRLELIEVKSGSISEVVNVTGKIKPAQDVSLAFERNGKVDKIAVKVGDKVSPGAPLAYLDQSELNANLNEALGRVAAERARLDDLRAGTRTEDIEITRTDLEKARQDLSNEYGNIPTTLNDAYIKADDGVRLKTVGIFSGDLTNYGGYHIIFSNCDSQAKVDSETGRNNSETALNSWHKKISLLAADFSNVVAKQALDDAREPLLTVKSFLDRLNDLLASGCSIDNTSLNTYRTNINAARSEVNAALTNINAQNQTIIGDGLAVDKIQNELNLKLAGSTPAQIAAQEAALREAEANADSIRVNIGKNILASPIEGVVTKQDFKLGQIVSANSDLISIISANNLEIEANVPEVDAVKIKINNPIKITFDALPGENFAGHVTYVDLAETIIDGVVNFKVTIALDSQDERLKSGLTANLAIETLKKDKVLYLPQFAIVENDRGTFVRIPDGKNTKDIPVTLGIRGEGGMVEITSGVSAGDKVINIGKIAK